MAIVPEELTDMWMGGWIGGQAEYVMVPYADFNEIPDKSKPWKRY
jgi:threonine dehydrogenase-like Zn-dependent dehydrogenase